MDERDHVEDDPAGRPHTPAAPHAWNVQPAPPRERRHWLALLGIPIGFAAGYLVNDLVQTILDNGCYDTDGGNRFALNFTAIGAWLLGAAAFGAGMIIFGRRSVWMGIVAGGSAVLVIAYGQYWMGLNGMACGPETLPSWLPVWFVPQ